MKLTYFGHSCFLVETCGNKLLFDPFITPNPLAAHIDVNTIEADAIFLSHGHEDHIADALSIAQRTGAPIISNWEIINWFGKQGVQNGHPMNIGGSWSFPFGRVKSTSAIHSSSLPDGSYGGNPGGFLIENQEGAFYYAGDTALTSDMQLLRGETPLRFAVLPIGDNFTMGIEDAAKAAEFVGATQVVGVHYDTFPYIVVDHSIAMSIFQKHKKTLHLPSIGETIGL